MKLKPIRLNKRVKNKKLNLKAIIAALVIVAIGIFVTFYLLHKRQQNIEDNLPVGTVQIDDQTQPPAENNSTAPAPQSVNNSTSNPLPSKILISVPFTSQAPFAVWDAKHEDACEEASLVMLRHFQQKTTISGPDQADQEIIQLIDYETANGYGISISANQLNQIAKSDLKMTTGRVIVSATIDKIKTELAAGRPVIIPAAGKLLGNPNFRNGGPNYHMLVIKGYDGNDFITNDPGTRNGLSYRYTFDTLFKAIHDWDPNNILNGPKNFLVFD